MQPDIEAGGVLALTRRCAAPTHRRSIRSTRRASAYTNRWKSCSSNKALKQQETQQRLAANVFRSIALGEHPDSEYLRLRIDAIRSLLDVY